MMQCFFNKKWHGNNKKENDKISFCWEKDE